MVEVRVVRNLCYLIHDKNYLYRTQTVIVITRDSVLVMVEVTVTDCIRHDTNNLVGIGIVHVYVVVNEALIAIVHQNLVKIIKVD